MKQSKNYDNYRFIVFERNRPTTINWTSGCPWHYLSYIMKGSCVIKAENLTLELHEGDLYYLPMGLSYKAHWKGGYCRARTMGFRIFPDYEEAGFIPQKLPKEFVPMHREIALQGQPDAETLGKFYTLLGKLVPIMVQETPGDSHCLVNRVRKEMSAWYLHASISKIASVCNVSESTLYHAFQKVEGKTPNTVRREIVIQEAIRLLTDTNTSIQRISNHLGFSSDTYFRKVFKEHTGLSPRQVRKTGYLPPDTQ